MKMMLDNRNSPHRPVMKSNRIAAMQSEKGKNKSAKALEQEKIEREMFTAQERILKLHMRQIKKADLAVLQSFMSGEMNLNARSYTMLSDGIKPLVNKLAYESSTIQLKYTRFLRHPIKNIRLKLGLWSLKKMVNPKKKKSIKKKKSR